MSDVGLEVKPVSNQEVDIYSDLISVPDDVVVKLKLKVEKLIEEKTLLIKSLSSRQKDYEDLHKDYKELEKKYKILSYNSSSLYKTAQAEIARKDRMIHELRREKDDLVFRKTSASHVLQRARRTVLSPRKKRTPIKKKETAESILSSKNKIPIEQSLISTPIENDTKVVRELVDEEDKDKVMIQENEIRDDSKSKKINNTTKHTPPPLQGPLTAYSKRLYKRIHGVSPQKPDCITSQDPDKDSILPEKTESSKENTSPKQKCMKKEDSETENNQQDNKIGSITSKLQEDVKEIIKLGSFAPNKSPPPSENKLSPDNKQRQHTTLTKDQKQNVCKQSSSQLIIHCDLRNISKENYKKSPNTVSINDTINNILKNKKAGLYSNDLKSTSSSKEVKPAKENPGRKGNKFGQLNKRTSDKLTISPATFGKLVSQSTICKADVTPINKKKVTISAKEETPELRKRKLSESSLKDVSPQQSQRPKLAIHPKTSRQNRFITSLFGESPLKSVTVDKNTMNSDLNEKSIEETRTPSPIERITHSSSPIFPDSPSLDSDNPEDLVIDTTVCSQNTSPRVSESEKKDISDENVNTPVKITLYKPTECQLLPENITKQSLAEIETSPNLASETDRDASTRIDGDPDQNYSLENRTTDCGDHGEEREGVTSLSEIIKFPENPSECLPLDNDVQNKCIASESNSLDVTGDNSRTVLLDTSHSSASLDKISYPDKSGQSKDLMSGENKNTKANNISEETPVTRFIPSPPQLTLVSAFKHSENSVFTLAEDTLGFVSALTRMRDISPIRTPDKNNKISNKTQTQTLQLGFIESKDSGVTTNKVITNSGSEFVNPIDQAFQNMNTSLSIKSDKTNHGFTNCNSLFKPLSEKFDSVGCIISPKPSEMDHKTNNVTPREANNTVKEPDYLRANKIQPSNPADSKQNFDKDATLKSNTKAQSVEHNPFKRSRPVRRLLSGTKNKLEISEQNKHANSNMNAVDPNSSQILKVPKENCKQKDILSSTSEVYLPIDKLVSNIVSDHIIIDKTGKKDEQKQQNIPIGAETTASGKVFDDKKTVHPTVKIVETHPNPDYKSENNISINKHECSRKTQEKSPPVPLNNNKSFKRSESLKTMPKRLPKVKIHEVSDNLSENRLMLDPPKGLGLSDETDVEKVPDENELNQISHVANINKRLRVSKYQSKSDKENFKQPKPSERSEIHQNKTSTSVRETTKTVSLESTKSILSISIRESKSDKAGLNKPLSQRNISHRNRKQNHRRSVSLGPEIRLRSNRNVSPFHRNYQVPTNTIHRCKESENVQSVSKLNKNKSSNSIFCEERNKKLEHDRKSDEHSKSKTRLSNLSSSSNNPKTSSVCPEPERVNNHLRKSRSVSPRDQPNHSRSESSDLEKKCYHRSRRSQSQSPESHNRSRSHYKHHSPRRSDSGDKRHRVYSRSRRRSRSPDPRHYRYHDRRRCSRSPHLRRRHRHDRRSRSRSPMFEGGKSDCEHYSKERYEKKGHRSRYYSKTSGSRSPHLSRKRKSRSHSPRDYSSDCYVSRNEINSSRKQSNGKVSQKICLQKNADDGVSKVTEQIEENTDDNSVMSYKEELEKMRKELDFLKKKINKNVESQDVLLQNNNGEEVFAKHQNHAKEASKPSVDSILVLIKQKELHNKDKMDSTSTTAQERHSCSIADSSPSNRRQAQQNRLDQEPRQENALNVVKESIKSPTTVDLQKEPKPIKVIRRVRRLGDSEVHVISSSSKLSNRTSTEGEVIRITQGS